MPEDERKKCLLTDAEIRTIREMRLCQPLNSNTEVHLRPLSELVGMQRVRLTLGRIGPAGNRSPITPMRPTRNSFTSFRAEGARRSAT
jgi:hypothetical protein